jgi:hypothetical protein
MLFKLSNFLRSALNVIVKLEFHHSKLSTLKFKQPKTGESKWKLSNKKWLLNIKKFDRLVKIIWKLSYKFTKELRKQWQQSWTSFGYPFRPSKERLK